MGSWISADWFAEKLVRCKLNRNHLENLQTTDPVNQRSEGFRKKIRKI